MSRLLTGIAIGLLLGLFGYYSLTLFSSNEIVSNDYAQVTIRNESGRNAKKIVLNHTHGTIEASGLKDKEELRFIFKIKGEDSYTVTVTFDDDSTLTSKSTYIEYGYRGTEIIKDSEVITKNNW